MIVKRVSEITDVGLGSKVSLSATSILRQLSGVEQTKPGESGPTAADLDLDHVEPAGVLWGVHGEFLIGPEVLVKCVRVQTAAPYLSTCPGRINCLARETQKTQDICGNRGFEESTPEQ